MTEKTLKLKLPSVDDLLEAEVHFGHQARRWHPKMEEYIFDRRKEIHILDLYKSEEALKKACEFLFDIAAHGGTIVFVGTKKQAREIIETEAKRAGAMFVSDRWVGGTITNFTVVKKNMDKLKDFMRKREDGSLSHYTKKERLLIDREIEKLQKSVGGILNLAAKPDALFVVDVKREKTAIREAAKLGVPVVALVDTNCDPTNIKYVIPGNDDAIRSISIITKALSDAVEAGYKAFASSSFQQPEQAPKEEVKPEEEPKKKRGRPKKTTEDTPKKRGRPKKAK